MRFVKDGWVGCGPIIVWDDKDDGVSEVMSGVQYAQQIA